MYLTDYANRVILTGNMMLTAAVIAISVFLAILLAAHVIYRRVTAAIDRYQSLLHDFIESPGPDQLSPLALIANSLADQAGHRIAVTLKTTLMGQASGLAKQQQALMADVTEDQMEAGNPLVAGLINQLGPRTKNRLMKNPALLEALAGMVSKGGGIGGGSSPGNNGGGSRPKFKL